MIESSSKALLLSLEKIGVEPVPKGWYPSKHYAEMWGIGLTKTRQLLRKGIKAGKIERRMYKVWCDGRLSDVPHYSPTK